METPKADLQHLKTRWICKWVKITLFMTLHIGRMLPLVKKWVDCKILGLLFGSVGLARFGVCAVRR